MEKLEASFGNEASTTTVDGAADVGQAALADEVVVELTPDEEAVFPMASSWWAD